MLYYLRAAFGDPQAFNMRHSPIFQHFIKRHVAVTEWEARDAADSDMSRPSRSSARMPPVPPADPSGKGPDSYERIVHDIEELADLWRDAMKASQKDSLDFHFGKANENLDFPAKDVSSVKLRQHLVHLLFAEFYPLDSLARACQERIHVLEHQCQELETIASAMQGVIGFTKQYREALSMPLDEGMPAELQGARLEPAQLHLAGCVGDDGFADDVYGDDLPMLC